jgi:hypothetical protein
MSVNIRIHAHRAIQVIKTGAQDTQSTEFDAWQTPTTATWHMMTHVDTAARLQAYRDWVMRVCQDETEHVYAEDDLFQAGEPVDTIIVNPGRDHIAQLDEWLRLLEQTGWEVSVDAG